MSSQPQAQIGVRNARPADVDAIAAIDAHHTGLQKHDHWKAMLASCRKVGGVALVARTGEHVMAFLLGEIRAWEFGSPPAGWIYAVGVHPEHTGSGAGRMLVNEARARFKSQGISHARTMVQRESVDLLRFFRSAGFVAGPFVQLEAPCDDAE